MAKSTITHITPAIENVPLVLNKLKDQAVSFYMVAAMALPPDELVDDGEQLLKNLRNLADAMSDINNFELRVEERDANIIIELLKSWKDGDDDPYGEKEDE